MVTLETVQKQVGELNISQWVISELDIYTLSNVLKEGEEINKVVKGEYRGSDLSFGIFRGKAGCLVATNERLIFLVALNPGNSRREDFWYEELVSVAKRNTKGNNLLRDIIINDGVNTKCVISHIYNSGFEEFFRYVESRVEELSRHEKGEQKKE